MHDKNAPGTDFFKCDFCRRPWAEDRPMVEGHRGSLICGSCLRAAHVEVVGVAGAAQVRTEQEKCLMCLETRAEPHWRSPLFEESLICRRCIRQSAQTLAKDPDSQWERPAAGAGGPEPDDD